MSAPKYDHKTPRFREGQYIVITKIHVDDKIAGLKLGYVYTQHNMKPWFYCSFGDGTGIREFYRYTREDRSNWRFAKTEEVKRFIDNKGPCVAIVMNVDNYSII